MKCPICGGELKRSTKNPEYGLCHTCRKKFRWKDEPEDYELYEPDAGVQKRKNGGCLMFALLFLLPPIGIIYLWIARKDISTKKRFIITFISLAWFAFCFAISTGGSGDGETKTKTDISDTQKTAKEFDVDESLIKNIISSCESVGMDKSKINIQSASNDGSSCVASVEYEDYLFDLSGDKDNNITYIASGDIVFLQNGNTQNVNDRLVTSDQKHTLMYQAEEDVKDNLKAPSTAEFPRHVLEASEWTINKNGNTYVVSSWVDAENGFGAQIRSNFIATYNWDGSEETQPELTDISIL